MFNNKVVDIQEQEFEVPSTMTWMDAPSTCQIGWLLESGSLIAPPEYEKNYAENRQSHYPQWQQQLEKIYDDGIDAWKTDMVDPIKAKYPKP